MALAEFWVLMGFGAGLVLFVLTVALLVSGWVSEDDSSQRPSAPSVPPPRDELPRRPAPPQVPEVPAPSPEREPVRWGQTGVFFVQALVSGFLAYHAIPTGLGHDSFIFGVLLVLFGLGCAVTAVIGACLAIGSLRGGMR